MIARTERGTPHLDAWRAHAARQLSERGVKTDLALWLANGEQAKIQSWRVQINRVLHQNHTPGAEFVLAVDQWLARRSDGRGRFGSNKKRRKSTKTNRRR